MSNVLRTQEQRERWYRYNTQYARKHYRTITLKLNKQSDADIIDYLLSQEKPITDVIREALRAKLSGGDK